MLRRRFSAGVMEISRENEDIWGHNNDWSVHIMSLCYAHCVDMKEKKSCWCFSCKVLWHVNQLYNDIIMILCCRLTYIYDVEGSCQSVTVIEAPRYQLQTLLVTHMYVNGFNSVTSLVQLYIKFLQAFNFSLMGLHTKYKHWKSTTSTFGLRLW